MPDHSCLWLCCDSSQTSDLSLLNAVFLLDCEIYGPSAVTLSAWVVLQEVLWSVTVHNAGEGVPGCPLGPGEEALTLSATHGRWQMELGSQGETLFTFE